MSDAHPGTLRQHDSEWLLQAEMRLNDRLFQLGKAGLYRPAESLPAIPQAFELDEEEVEAARRAVDRFAGHLGAKAVQEILEALGLQEVSARRRICQGCKRRAPAEEFADRGDGVARCPSCCARRPFEPLGDDVKRCRDCRSVRPRSDFLPRPSSPDGLQSRCAQCRDRRQDALQREAS